MAIEKIGESLLSNVRQRNDEVARQNRKAQRKDELKALGMTLAVGVGNKMLADRTADFLNNEQILASNVLFKNASLARTQAADEQKRIDQHKGTAVDFYRDQMKPEFETQFKLQQDPDEIGTKLYESKMFDELTALATARADAHKKLYESTLKIKDADTVNASIVKEINSVRPQKVGDLITSGIANLFSGTSKQEREQAAIQSIIKNDPNRERTIALAKEFERTGNAILAKNFSDMVVPKTPDEERYQTTIDHEIQTLNDVAYLIETTTQKDRYGLRPDIVSKPKATKFFGTNTEETKANVLKTANTAFNLSKEPAQLLTSPAYAEFVKAVGDKNIVLGNIKTIEQYNTVAEILQTFTVDNQNLKDKERSDIVKAILSSFVSNSIATQGILAKGSDDEVEAAVGKIIDLGSALKETYSN